MRNLLLLVSALLLINSPVASQEIVGLFTDETGVDCGLQDREVGVCIFYVVHKNAFDRTGVEFKIDLPTCSQLIFAGHQILGPVSTGTLDDGYSVAYGAPRTGDIPVMYIQFFCQGLSSECCLVSIVAHPHTGQLVAADASHALHDIVGLTSVINPNGSCACQAVATETTTWGRVKALYN